MSTPSITLKFRKVRGDLPTYGAQSEEISRRGLNGHRFKSTGARGGKSSMECTAFYRTFADANAGAASVTVAQGNEIFLASELDTWQIRCFLASVAFSPPQRIESTRADDLYRIVYKLEIIRTQ
jgi:hypothetical protein